jgi:beta-glucanase (GH16 family)
VWRLSRERFSQLGIAGAVLLVAWIGVHTVMTSWALTAVASQEAEQGTVAGNALAMAADTASGGAAVKFDSQTGTSTYTFDDEFNGSSGSLPDVSHWNYDVGNGSDGWGNQELEYNTDDGSNSYLDGQGHLVIKAAKYNGTAYHCWNGPCQYTSARLLTKNLFAQAYGHFEARIQMPNVQLGLWPAFWALGNDIDTVDWPQCGEIDIMENYGYDAIEGSTHGPLPANDTAADKTLSLINAWHTYAIDWSSTQISFSVDGVIYGTTTKAQSGANWVFDHPFFLILNMAVGGSGTGNTAPQQLPASLLVDYVRVSQ